MQMNFLGEGPFLLIINKQYSSKLNRITLVLAEEVDESIFQASMGLDQVYFVEKYGFPNLKNPKLKVEFDIE